MPVFATNRLPGARIVAVRDACPRRGVGNLLMTLDEVDAEVWRGRWKAGLCRGAWGEDGSDAGVVDSGGW